MSADQDLVTEAREDAMVDAADRETGVKEGLHFDLPNDDYHGLTDWLSSTQLKRLLPEHYDEGSMSQPALDFVTLVHSVVLEPDTLDHYVTADAAKIGVKADGTRATNPTSTSAWKAFVAEAEESGQPIVSRYTGTSPQPCGPTPRTQPPRP